MENAMRNASVNDLAVWRTGDRAGLGFSLQHGRFNTALCQSARDGKAHHPGTDHHAIHSVSTMRVTGYYQTTGAPVSWGIADP
jgi:hypothetical protein